MNTPAPDSSWPAIVRLLRPAHWVKNGFVLAPLVFSGRLLEAEVLGSAVEGFVAFCLASSAAYVLNDIRDRDRDSRHPIKLRRPLASGEVSLAMAIGLGLMLTAGGLAIAWRVGPVFTLLLASFLGLQAVYSLGLKQVVVVDVVAIAAGFVLRAAAGVVAVDARISGWLFLCTFLLALFLALAKRRHEITLLGGDADGHREVLGRYTKVALDRSIGMVAVCAVVAYSIYALWPAVAEKLGTERLYLTIPFVVFGVLRYLFLVYGRAEGGNPTKVLLADLPLQAVVGCWGATVIALLYG